MKLRKNVRGRFFVLTNKSRKTYNCESGEILSVPKQTMKVLCMVMVNHQLPAAFKCRNMYACQGDIEPIEVIPYP